MAKDNIKTASVITMMAIGMFGLLSNPRKKALLEEVAGNMANGIAKHGGEPNEEELLDIMHESGLMDIVRSFLPETEVKEAEAPEPVKAPEPPVEPVTKTDDVSKGDGSGKTETATATENPAKPADEGNGAAKVKATEDGSVKKDKQAKELGDDGKVADDKAKGKTK